MYRVSEHIRGAWSSFALAVALSACSASVSNGDERGNGAAGAAGALAASSESPSASAALAPPVPSVAPELPDVSERDRDGDRIDDAFASISGERSSVELEVILNAPTQPQHLAAFRQLGGTVQHVFRAVSYGWTGRLPPQQLSALRDQLGAELRIVAAPKPTALFLDEATRSGRVRPTWASGFAGLAGGVSGNANITIAILDTGVDGTHVDLSGRMVGFKDYTADHDATATDVVGHGTHVASIALGSGAAFGLGPGTLRYTDSGSLNGVSPGFFTPVPIHTLSYFGESATLSVSSTATFGGGGSTTLSLSTTGDGAAWVTSFASATGTSPLSVSGVVASSSRFSDALAQANPATIGDFAVANAVSGYPAVGDGYGPLRGVAPSCNWFDAKVFSDSNTGNSSDIGVALDDMVALRVTNKIKIVNMSLGIATGTDTALRAKANNAVNNGIVVVVAAGNSGPSTAIGDPGLASKVLTVGASNDKNELTTYTSIGGVPSDSSTDYKPDLLAPGGSTFRSLILAADSNTKDAASSTFPDVVKDDYALRQGTSMASPFAAGAAALIIDAWQRSGVTWTAASSAQPLFIKMLMLASATETNTGREQGATNSPSLGRASAPKDSFEGFGMLNPDAAIEAISQALPSSLTGNVNNVLPARLEWERRAWGRKVSLINGSTVALDLTVPSTADFDLYLYAGSGDANGSPVIRAASTNAGLHVDEAITFTSATTETAYVFVKRISGYGSFTLGSSTIDKCGNGSIDTGEACDPGSVGQTPCCSATCQAAANGTPCSTGTCSAGSCVAPMGAGGSGGSAGTSSGGTSGASASAGSASGGTGGGAGSASGGASGTPSAAAGEAGAGDAAGDANGGESANGGANVGGNEAELAGETGDTGGAHDGTGGSLASAGRVSEEAGSSFGGGESGAPSTGDGSTNQSSGCGCSAAGAAPQAPQLAWLLALLIAGGTRRRARKGGERRA